MEPEMLATCGTVLSVLVPVILGGGLVLRATGAARRALASAFGAGACVALGTWGVLQWRGAFTAASRWTLDGAVVNAFVGAALPEETAKLLCLGAILWFGARRGLSVTLGVGVLAGLTLGLGFATVENLVYGVRGETGTGLVRLVTAVPCHAFLGVVMGHYLAFGTRRLGRAWLVPLVAHGLYNLPLLLDARALPASNATEDLLLSCLVLLWLAVWTRVLLSAAFAPLPAPSPLPPA